MHSSLRFVALAALGTLLWAALPATARPQAGPASAPERSQSTREELTALLDGLRLTGESSAYSAALRGRARNEAALIHARLRDGDFQVGDQVVLVVAGEPTLTDTFTVRSGPTLYLPEVGEVQLRGVLRSELEPHLAAHLGRYLRLARVQAHSMVRIAISGAVARPGFFVVPAHLPLSEVVMAAGGFAGGADITRIRVKRDGEEIWGGRPLQHAVSEGRSLDQMSFRAGDQIDVPMSAPNATLTHARGALLSIPALILSITALQSLF